MKVLHVIGGVGPGGAETVMYRLVTRASEVRHEVICLGDADWYSEGLERHGIQVHYLGMSRPRAIPSALGRLPKLVRLSGADVVQGWMYRSNVLASLAARSAGLPSVWSIHCASLEPLGITARFWAYVSGASARRLPTAIVNCSRRSMAMHENLGFDRAKVEWIPNGYDPAAFTPDESSRQRTRTNLRITEGEFVIGTVSRWHAEKDIPNLLQAIAKLKARGVRVRCLLIGHRLDSADPALSDAIRAADVRTEIVPLGRRGDIPDLFRAMDLLALPSRSESFPNVVPEAMLCATPCAVTDVGDAQEIVGETGWVIPPRDPSGLANAISDARDLYMTDPTAWRQRCSAARRRIATRFTLEKMGLRYEKLWRSVSGIRAELHTKSPGGTARKLDGP